MESDEVSWWIIWVRLLLWFHKLQAIHTFNLSARFAQFLSLRETYFMLAYYGTILLSLRIRVSPFQILNHFADSHNIWYKIYAFRRHPRVSLLIPYRDGLLNMQSKNDTSVLNTNYLNSA